MSHLPFALAAYFLNAVAVTIDKFLLSKAIPDPLIYIFYFSLVSLIALVALPFTHIPPSLVLILASLSTILWTTGAYFMFKALQQGHLARVIPIIGTLIPLILLGHALFEQSVSFDEVWAVIILILGLIFLTIPDWKGGIRKKEVLFELFSAALFAYSYILLRQAFLQDHYFSVFVWSRMILLPLGFAIMVIPSLRRRILTGHQTPQFNILSMAGALFLFGQIAGGISELLITFSVALANPAVVNSLQGTQFIFLFIFSLILAKKYPSIFREQVGIFNFLGKILGILLIGFGLYILSFAEYPIKKEIKLGATFSPRYAQSLGIDPKKTYLRMLDELNIKLVRLPIYWDEVEKSAGMYEFSGLDFYLLESQKRGVEVILVVGLKQPRWPECFTPTFVFQLSRLDKDQKILNLVEREINYFKKYPHISAWQIENEPFLEFGLCLTPDSQSRVLLQKEVELVKSIDYRPVLITDSGELSTWIPSVKMGDIFGTTIYRTVWNPYLGLVDYPFPPVFYHLKGAVMRALVGKPTQEMIISELQTEPWIAGQQDIRDVDPDSLAKQFPVSKLKKHLQFAQETKINTALIWGIEWIYYMEEQNHPEYLEYTKTLFHNNY